MHRGRVGDVRRQRQGVLPGGPGEFRGLIQGLLMAARQDHFVTVSQERQSGRTAYAAPGSRNERYTVRHGLTSINDFTGSIAVAGARGQGGASLNTDAWSTRRARPARYARSARDARLL